MILSFIALSPLRQALAQRVAEALDDHDGDKEDNQDHAKAVVFAPADLFIHDKAQSARAHIAEDGIQKSCIMSGPPSASLRDAIKYACASTEGENDHPRASETILAFSSSTVCGLSMPPMKNPRGSPAGRLRRDATTLHGSNGL